MTVREMCRQTPHIERDNGRAYLVLGDGRDYRIPDDPIKAMGLLHHLASKTWATREFLCEAIAVMAGEMDWPIHPF